MVFHAVARLGAILTTVNPAYTNEEVAFQLRDSGARAARHHGGAVGAGARLAAAASLTDLEIVTIDAAPDLPSLDAIALDADPPPVAIDPATDVVALPYSSGTTGLPKGVMLTHRNLVANLVQIDAIEVPDLTAFAGVLPFFHIYGMVVIMNFGLMRGATIVTLPRFELEPFLQHAPGLAHRAGARRAADRRRPGQAPVVDRYDLSRVKWLFSGAAPLGAELTEAVERGVGVRVRQGYGMTEAAPRATTRWPAASVRARSVCWCRPPSAASSIRDRGRPAAGGAGEVWVRGPQVMKGYLNNPEATARPWTPTAGCTPATSAWWTSDGFLEVADRLKELIKVKGYQVAPAELEALLLKHPAIADAAVIPIPDDEAGERPKAFVVASGPLTVEEVCAFVDAHVAHYKRLAAVAFIDTSRSRRRGRSCAACSWRRSGPRSPDARSVARYCRPSTT